MIAVLDYGIGNLRSAEKALQHLGADAALVSDPRGGRGRPGVVLPGRRQLRAVHGGAAGTRARPGGPGRGGVGPAVPRDLRGHADALRGVRGVPGRGRPRRAARTWSAGCPTASSGRRCSGTGCCWTSRRIRWSRAWARALGVLRALLRPAGRTTSVVATCDYGGPGGGGRGLGTGCGRPSSTPRSPGPVGPGPAGQLRGGRGRVRAGPEGPWTSIRPSTCAAGAACAWWKATSPRRPCTATTRSRWPGPSQAAGARWIHVVDLDAARTGEPVNRAVVARIAAARGRADGRGSRRAAGCGRSRRRGAALRRGGPGGARHGRGGGPRAGRRDRRPLARPGGGGPRPPARRGPGPGLDRGRRPAGGRPRARRWWRPGRRR